ncbi:hypothetical protein Sjap_009808 [Stephania japonica]|uniref:Uncharacterized protein n=1 Tax=Stephania japonica TaxID=461633 RepID=A0AAP0J8D0_9MAGN
MITRSNLAEQLREYETRSHHSWPSDSFLFFNSNLNSSSRSDVIFVIWELVILAFLVASAVSLYLRYMQLAFIFICLTMLLVIFMKILKQVRASRTKNRRMLLPLSM